MIMVRSLKRKPGTHDWIRTIKGGAELASICTGAFLVAATACWREDCSTPWNAAMIQEDVSQH